uniref:CHCH domain-containing protein n=1 Tax=Oryzias latipes TaxID=8090 RepID=A0A3P9JP78_ORYLA
MSSVRQEVKDKIIFVTKEDHEAPSNAELVEEDPNDPYEEQGLILPGGDINWNCPCLGGMASGPCGTEFKDAFSYCMEQFTAMQQCLQLYPELYPQEDEASPKQSSKDSAAEGPSANKEWGFSSGTNERLQPLGCSGT